MAEDPSLGNRTGSPLPLPLWIVSPRTPTARGPHKPNTALGFATIDSLAAFLETRGSGDWAMRHVVNHTDLLFMVADLHQQGIQQLCLEPNPDGSGGSAIGLDQILQQVDPKQIRHDGNSSNEV